MSEVMIAPGAHILVRDAVWRVTKVVKKDGEPKAINREEVHAVGVSELVRDQEVCFLPLLEAYGQRNGIKVLDPRETELVLDASSGHLASRLYIESSLRRTPPSDDHLYGDEGGHSTDKTIEPRLYLNKQAAMDAMDFQSVPSIMALKRPRQRILIADNVGLGKTLSCGILMSELILRGRGKRILVLTQKSMLSQFQREMWSRFTIPLVRLDSIGLQRVRAKIPAQHNPFNHYNRIIISIDTLKQQNIFKTYLEQSHWDIIVIDEAQNVAVRGQGKAISNRAELAKLLAARSESLILLSATPHDGKPESFASLMNMLDPTAISDPKNFSKDEIQDLYVRRFKKDVADQLAQGCPEREIHRLEIEAGSEENRAYNMICNLQLQSDEHKKGAGYRHLFKVLLKKSFLSSPTACLSTLDKRIKEIERRGEKAPSYLVKHTTDLKALKELQPTIKGIVDRQDESKFKYLLNLIKTKDKASQGAFKLAGKDRLVIFTERVDTMKWLANSLYAQEDLKLKITDKTTKVPYSHYDDVPKDQAKILTLSGQMSDVDINTTVELFGQEKAKLRILIASDVASEGLNLHFQCNRLIHYDIPWSLMVFLQRNGRIDRYGQTQTPHIAYLLYNFEEEAAGDHWVLDKLIEREQKVHDNLGDPTLLTGVHTIEEEEEQTAQDFVGITDNPQAIDPAPFSISSPVSPPVNPLTSLMQSASVPLSQQFSLPTSEQAQTSQVPQSTLALMQSVLSGTNQPLTQTRSHRLASLFENDFEYFKAGIEFVNQQEKQAAEAQGLSSKAHKFELDINQDEQTIKFKVPADLKRRFKSLPQEALAEAKKDNRLTLYAEPKAMQDQITQARTTDSPWPETHYLWRNSPIFSWLGDRIERNFNRQVAPILRSTQLATQETALLVYAVLPSLAGTPLFQETYVHLVNQQNSELIRFEDFLQARSFLKSSMSNPAEPLSESKRQETQSLVAGTIDQVLEHLQAERKHREAKLKQFIDLEMSLLEKRQEARMQALVNQFSKKSNHEASDEPQHDLSDPSNPSNQTADHLDKLSQSKTFKDEKAKIDKLFAMESQRLKDRFTMENQPFVKIIAVIVNGAN